MNNGKIKTLPISVFVVTKNEERNIGRLLASCTMMDEVIIVDSGSTDETVTIAKNYGVEIFFNEWPGYSKQKAYAMSLCKNEWVLNLDADEELTPELVQRFSEIIISDKYDAVRCQRNDVFMGHFFSKFTKKPNNCRLYKKKLAKFDTSRLAHESADVDGTEIFINEAFNHYGYGGIKEITHKNNIYSSLKAEEKFEKGKKASIAKLILIFPMIFIKTYILQGYIFSGMRGFIMSIMTAYYMFIKEAKLYELNKENKL